MLNSAVEIIAITVSLLKIALRLDNSNRIGMIKGIEFSCHFLGRNQRILIMNLNWKLFRFCFIYRRRLITNVFHVRIINLETIITINRPRLRNQTLPKHRNLMCLIKFYRLCLFRSLLFHFVSLKKKCFIVLLFPSKSAMAVAVCVCVCVRLFVLLASFVRLEDVHDSLSPASGSTLAVINGFPSTGDLSFRRWRHTVTWPSCNLLSSFNCTPGSISQPLPFLNSINPPGSVNSGNRGHLKQKQKRWWFWSVTSYDLITFLIDHPSIHWI